MTARKRAAAILLDFWGQEALWFGAIMLAVSVLLLAVVAAMAIGGAAVAIGLVFIWNPLVGLALVAGLVVAVSFVVAVVREARR